MLLDLAGVENIAAGQPIPWPEATSEWLVEQNPDLIIKVASATFIKNGYGVVDVKAIDAFRKRVDRPAGLEPDQGRKKRPRAYHGQ